MKFIKRLWHKLLIFFRIRKEIEFYIDPQVLHDVNTYQQASLAMLQNLSFHISTADLRFKHLNKLKPDFSEGKVTFKQ